MVDWLKGCEICNVGLCSEMDRLIKDGISERNAARLMAQEAKSDVGVDLYSATSIRNRYQYYRGKKKVAQNEPDKIVNRAILKAAADINKERYEKEKTRREKVKHKRQANMVVIAIEQRQCLMKLEKTLRTAPKAKEIPSTWDDTALNHARTIAKLIVKRLEPFLIDP